MPLIWCFGNTRCITKREVTTDMLMQYQEKHINQNLPEKRVEGKKN